jgi:hypothetical protein
VRRSIARDDHGKRAAGIGRTQACTQIVRILHSVEGNDDGLLRYLSGGLHSDDEIVLRPGRQRADVGRNTLMTDIAHLLPEDLSIHSLHRDLTPAGKLIDLADAGVIAALSYPHRTHALRVLLEHHPHGMQAIDGL